MTGAAHSLGFIAEIEANKWVYKGERFKFIATIEKTSYAEKYLRMISLFQMGICASANKSRCVDILISNFSVDGWLDTFRMTLGTPNGPQVEMFEGLPNFDKTKLAMQVQLLF